MNTINDFLEKPITQESQMIKLDMDGLGQLNTLFLNGNVSMPSFMGVSPKIKKNQIWSVKFEYLDYEGEQKKSKHPIMVLLTSDCEDLDNETQFVRGCPISPFTEMAADNEQKCDDPSIVGFPFIVETWNEQPMLTDILEKYVADFYADVREIPCNLNQEQQRFREIEISNALFLNNSVSAYIKELERSNNFSFSVDVSFADYIRTKHMPQFNLENPNLVELPIGEEYATAAKTGNLLTDNGCIDFDTENLPFRIEIRKKRIGFVITIIPKLEVCLKSGSGEEIIGSSNTERVVFNNLKKGLYTIASPLSNEIITVRLK